MNDATTCLYSTFHVGNSFYGIEVSRVQEVLREQHTTPVPLTASDVSGLINLRGQIVTSIDLRRRLGHVAPGSGESYVVVIRAAAGLMALVVDQIGDVHALDERARDVPPPTLRGDARSLVVGVHVLDRQILQVLDVDRLVALVAA